MHENGAFVGKHWQGKTELLQANNLNNKQRFSSCITENIACGHYKDQSVGDV